MVRGRYREVRGGGRKVERGGENGGGEKGGMGEDD